MPATESHETRPIYRYVDKAGQTVFVNDPASIPSEFRARAQRVDLSHVSLNEALGRDLAAQSAAQSAANAPADGGARASKDAGADGTRMVDGVLIPASPMAPLDPKCLTGMTETAKSESVLDYAKDNPHVPVILGFIVVLVLALPIAVRKIGSENYMKLLSRAVPLLLLMLALTHGALAFRRGARDLKSFLVSKPSTCLGAKP